MNGYNELYKKIKHKLSPKRWQHTQGVIETAVKLAEYYGKADVEKIKIAALLHDCARYLSVDEMVIRAKKMNLVIDEMLLKEPILIHADLGAKIAEMCYGVQDQEILQAIRRHTLGDLEMTLMDKIIFIADVIEPGRDFKGIEKLRKVAYKNIDHAILSAIEQTIIYVLKKAVFLHPKTVLVRNAFLEKL